jgi:glyoxylase-like metal-dependent hydrolase (beta-lactamase superfamily II)
MEKIKNIYCIEGLGSDSNSYLINETTLIDTGTGLNPDYISSKLEKNGIKNKDIELIINTHCHYDHAGGNYLFENAKIAIHKMDAPAVEHEHDPLIAYSIFHHDLKRHDVDLKLKDGDTIADFKVIHTPGHTPGGICLLQDDVLISGDTLFANGGVGRLDIGGNYENMKKSIEKLNKINCEYLLPGHGPWVNNAKKHLNLTYETF